MKRLNVSLVCARTLPYKVITYIDEGGAFDKIKLCVGHAHGSLIYHPKQRQLCKDLYKLTGIKQ